MGGVRVKCDRDKTVWMDEELELALYRLAEGEDRKFSAYCRMVLARHVENCERGPKRMEGTNSPAPPLCSETNFEAEYWRQKYLKATSK